MSDFIPTEYEGLEVRRIQSCIQIFSCEKCGQVLGKYNDLYGYQQKYAFCSKSCFLEWMKDQSQMIKINEGYLGNIATEYVESISKSGIDHIAKKILIDFIIFKLTNYKDTL